MPSRPAGVSEQATSAPVSPAPALGSAPARPSRASHWSAASARRTAGSGPATRASRRDRAPAPAAAISGAGTSAQCADAPMAGDAAQGQLERLAVPGAGELGERLQAAVGRADDREPAHARAGRPGMAGRAARGFGAQGGGE